MKHTICASLILWASFVSFGLTLPDQEWERIDLDDDHTSIEASDKSRRNAAIPTETAGDLEVPSVLRGFQVVSIGKQAFYGCRNLTSVTIPEGVTNIADEAFYNCSSLTNVVFPSTLKSIGASAFIGCQKLASINIEAPRLTIGDRAFRNCDGLQAIRFVGDELIANTRAFFGCGGLRDVNLVVKDITLSEGVFFGGYDKWTYNGKSYDASCDYCDRLTNVVVAASNRIEIGASSFSSCTALQAAVLTAPETSTIGSSVFSDCTALQTIELPEGLVGVSSNAFLSCKALQSVSLSSNVTTIAYRAFDTCTSLRTVALPEGLQKIGAQAFYGCAALEDLRVPQSVTQIGDRAFERCDELGRLVFCEGDTNTPVAAAVSVGERAFYRNGSLTNVVLSQAVSKLGARAFAECGLLTTVNLPTKLVEVSESLFELCEKLEKVDFSPKLTAIGSSAFNACSSLATFSIPTQNVVSVGSKSFYKTKYWNDWPDDSIVVNNGYILGFKGSTTSVVLPDDCRAIPNGMFEGMTALTNVTVPAVLEKIGSRAFYGSGIISIDLSETKVSTIGASAFADCPALLSAILPSALMAIPDDAFRNCSTLVSIDIPAKVASIGASAFRDCVSLMTVSGGTGVRSVGDYAFAGCVKLQPFRFGENVAYGEHVFQYVEWTENVLFPSVGTMAQEYPQTYAAIKSVVISSTLTGIVDRACFGCASLEDVSIPESVRGIGTSAFEGCVSLKSIVFPGDFSNIGSNAFKGCSSVASLTVSGGFVVRDVFREVYASISDVKIAGGATSLCEYCLAGCAGLTPGITIPEKVESIGDYAFMGCTGLDIVRYMGPMPNANPNIYAGTKVTLVSGVRKKYAESWTQVIEKASDSEVDEDDDFDNDDEGELDPEEQPSSQTVSAALPEHWPSPQNNVNSRRIAWWDGPSGGSGGADGIVFYYYDTTGGKETRNPADWLDRPPEREGYDFLGWFTKPYGGVEVTEENYKELGVTKVYAHWVRNRDDHNDPQEWGDVVYDVNKTHVYDGYLLDGGQVAGTVKLSLAKGKYDREEESTSVKMTAKIMILGEGKTLSLKGTAYDVGEEGGYGTLEKGDREADIEFTPNGMSGGFDGYDIVGARNMFDEKTDWDKRTARAALDNCGDARAVVLQSNGDSPLANGFVALTISFSSKGKSKVSGVLPDGTKVNVTSQLLVFEDRCVLPVVAPLYSGKRGGFGFSVTYPNPDETGEMMPYVDELTSWVANPGRGTEFVADLSAVGIGNAGNLSTSSVFSMEDSFDVDDAMIEDSLLPVDVEVAVSGTKWVLPKADKVKFDRESESYEVTTEYGNSAGLKLTYTAKTGMFKGSFKVYAVTDAGKSKKYTATVNGAVVDGVGYGTAFIKKVGAAAIVITPNE